MLLPLLFFALCLLVLIYFESRKFYRALFFRRVLQSTQGRGSVSRVIDGEGRGLLLQLQRGRSHRLGQGRRRLLQGLRVLSIDQGVSDEDLGLEKVGLAGSVCLRLLLLLLLLLLEEELGVEVGIFEVEGEEGEVAHALCHQGRRLAQDLLLLLRRELLR